jgi:hypothetical protein
VPVSDANRDRAVETLLRAVLTRTETSAQGPCVDGETIAAWMSGRLRADAADNVERHVASCTRCAALTATFLHSSPEPEARATLWRRWRLAWLVPVATAAAALAVWFAIPGRGPVPFRPESAAPEMSAKPANEIAPSGAPVGRAPAETAANQARASSDRPRPEPAAVDKRADRTGSPDQPAPPSLQETATKPLAVDTTAPQPQPAAPAERDQLRERSARILDDSNASAAPSSASSAPHRALGRVASTFAKSEARASLELSAAAGLSRWRVTQDQRVEWSTTGGTSWKSTDIPPPAPLLAGAAPTPSICWLAGRDGVVFLTTDGDHFVRLPFPERVDLIHVSAVDDRTATVTATDARMWRTSDGGHTWTPVDR